MVETKELHEINRYDDSGFPFEMYKVSKDRIIPEGRGYKDLHWHEELQFTLVTSGTLTMQIYDKTYDLKEGEGIFINAGLLHMTTMLSSDGEYVSFNFPEKMLGFFTGSRMEQQYVLPYTRNKGLLGIKFSEDIPWNKKILDALKEMKQIKETTSYTMMAYELATILVGMWLELIKHIEATIVDPHPSWLKKQRRIQTFIGFIHDHYTEDIRLEDIAESGHVSVGECGRCFKSVLNMTPYEYLIRYRVNRSMDLLNETDYTITEIATSVGFNYVGHYIQHFKKRIGQTPNQYRNSYWQ